MMATVELPPRLPEVAEPDACEAARSGGGPSALADTLRATGTTLSDVVDAAGSVGAPGDWEGLTASAAGYRLAAFSHATDGATAAVEVAVRGLDVYDHQVGRAATRWSRLDEDRRTLNRDIDDLRTRVDEAVAAGDLDPAAVDGLRAESRRLAERREGLVTDYEVLATDVAALEDRLVGVLEAVDTTDEGDRAADRPDRPDVPALVEELRRAGDDPDAVHRWWEGLTPAERSALTLHDPGLVGGTDGIPTGARDEANRAQLEHDLEHLHGLQQLGVDLTDDQERLLQNAEQTQAALDDAGPLVDPRTGLPVDVNLLLYQPDRFGGDGAGAITYGDPDTADNTVVLVPGLGSDMSTLSSLGEDAQRILEQTAGSGESVSVVGWIGYDAPSYDGDVTVDDVLRDGPDFLGVGGEGKAEAGGHELVELVDGLRATDDGDQSHLTVIGHSYGSTTAAHGAADGLDEDSLVLLGSPGAGGGVDDASDLGAPQLYVGSAENDPVTWLGRHGSLGLGPDPAQSGFGGTRIEVDPGDDFDVDEIGSIGFDQNHSSYFDEGSTSLDNIGDIAVGDPPSGTDPGRDQPAHDYLRDWLGRRAEEHVVDPFRDHVVDPLHDAYERTRDAAEDALDDALDSLVTFGTRGLSVGVL